MLKRSIILMYIVQVLQAVDFIGVGLYNIHYKRIEKCPNEGTKELDVGMKLNKISRYNVILEITANFSVPLDKNVSLKIGVDVWGNGGWRNNFFLLSRDDICETIYQAQKKSFISILKAAGLPTDPPCPIAPGYYIFKIGEKDLNNIPIVLIMGMYRATLNLVRKQDSQILGCIRSVYEISPKRII